MKQILQFFISKFLLVTAVSKILLIGITITLYSPVLSANDSKAPFSISGNLEITHISDGDSLRSGNLRIRLFGIDAPEKKQKCADVDGRQWDCGVAAKKVLKQLVESVPHISCDLMDVDRYSRLLMRCYAGEKDVAATLVREGLALAYRQYSTLYSQDENAAKISKAGMWSGSFTKPWKWRRNR